MDVDSPLLVRPVREDDLDGLLSLLASIPDSITSLQPETEYLQRRIDESLRSFYPVVHEPGPEKYFFVLEDIGKEQLAGTCCIYARTGGYEPFYTYEIVDNEFRHEPLGIETRISELHLRAEHRGPSEFGGLFLHKDYRGGGIGGALSRSRFLFCRLFHNRFTEEVVTEFRGVVTESGEVPFWEAIGRHFFVHDFFTLDQYSAIARKDFIHDLMPRHPIYVPLLPETAQAVIGKPHPAAEPAVHVLEKEGFSFTNHVDIFDAGPLYQATLADTVSYSSCRRGTISDVVGSVDGKSILISNTNLEFRALSAPAEVKPDGSVTLDRKSVETLELERGDEILYLPGK